jgi:hypothetical protein
MKKCSKCGTEKPLSDFPQDNRTRGVRTARTGKGVGAACKACNSEARKPGLQNERERRADLKLRGLKTCGKCEQAKPFSDFHKRVASADGLAFKCKACVNIDTETWRDKNPGAHAEWYEKNKDLKAASFKDWRAKNADGEPARIAAWSKANPHKVNAKIAKRRAAKLRAVPVWANHAAIADVYAEAARLRKTTGERYEVDHIVPLQGKTVSGLHWEQNLQILLKAENIAKLNRRWPDMPT